MVSKFLVGLSKKSFSQSNFKITRVNHHDFLHVDIELRKVESFFLNENSLLINEIRVT